MGLLFKMPIWPWVFQMGHLNGFLLFTTLNMHEGNNSCASQYLLCMHGLWLGCERITSNYGGLFLKYGQKYEKLTRKLLFASC